VRKRRTSELWYVDTHSNSWEMPALLLQPCIISPACYLRAALAGTVVPRAQQRNSLTVVCALVTCKQVKMGFIAVGARAFSFQVCLPSMMLVSSGFLAW